ncbi:MAG: Mu-like prophage major head subunit gpT family protein [Lentisphaeria bacterium]|nr:Mu-like prophage major head subunit gpT family protein [Lentisphaeria bacterium]MBR3708683.1 Mu-like prophage major head subunit gpT family protein [Lentisphaeria bacterium]MBR4075999.1 Mu-like prophage major head subunit gpT family protein [Lentisphaeria bacterium]
MDINRKNMDALFAGFKSNFTNGFQLAPETWKKFSAVVQSGTASNIYPFLEQFGGMSEWQSERNVKNVASHRIEVVNRDFEETVSIARNDIEDDQYGIYGTLIAEMGRHAAKVWQDLAVEALLGNGNWIDEKPFFSADRVYGESTICNMTTGELTAENYAAARKTMMEYRGHSGKSLGIVPDLLIVGPKNEAAAFSILKDRMMLRSCSKDGVSGIGATDNPWNGSAELLVLPELSGTEYEDLWFLASTCGVIKPVFVQQRKTPVLTSLDRESDENVFSRKEYIYGTDARGEAFLAFPHLIYKGGCGE